MRKTTTVLATCMFAIGALSQAAIVEYSENFSTGNGGWTAVMGSPTITWAGWHNDYDDGDPTQILPYSEGMATGDGVVDDGGLLMGVQNSTVEDEAIGYNLSGTLENGETITFEGSLYTGGNWWYGARAQIWNVTENSLLATTGIMVLKNPTAEADYAPVNFSVEYTATAADAGDIVQIRILEYSGSTSRRPVLDCVSVTTDVVPEPASVSLILFGCAGLFAVRRHYVSR